jgi:hypothetical protein
VHKVPGGPSSLGYIFGGKWNFSRVCWSTIITM